jgi:NhaP-type Na+/H+ or K+/H+ antiporter
MGPHCANLFNPGEWGGPSDAVTDEITLEVTRIIIAVSVFAVGVELPKVRIKSNFADIRLICGGTGGPSCFCLGLACYGAG